MVKLFYEDFNNLNVGPLPVDFSAAGEYHYLPPPGSAGQWYDPIRDYSRPRHAPWLIIEDDGQHRLLQTIDASREWTRMLIAGNDDWSDYTLTVQLQPLKTDDFVGLCFRYRTGRSHYRFGLDGGRALKLIRVNHEEHDTLAERDLEYSSERSYELKVKTEGDNILAYVDGELMFQVHDDKFSNGRIGLVARTPCIYSSVEVTSSSKVHTAFMQTRERRQRELDELRQQYPKPELWKQISTKGFGTARQIRFGHLQSKNRLDILLAQNIKLLPGSDNLATVRCLTAIDLDGNILWQFGEPGTELDACLVTADLPVQIYDIDGDGQDEVLCLKNFKLYILNGQTGEVKNVCPLPLNPREENHFGRLVGDAIIIANFRGLDRPSDILIKNRYRQIWAFDNELNLLWTHEFPPWNTGHFPQPYDFDGDGRDELYVGYRLLGPDGEVIWSHDWRDHTDEIAIGPFDSDRDDVQIAIACGEAGFNILAADGTVLHREMLGHAQRLSAAKFRKDLPGLQFYLVTYWGCAGIISFHDCKGKRLFEFEPTSVGNLLAPVNWTGDGVELALLSGSLEHGGMLDGYGRRVVVFPNDGHPEMCAEVLNLTGDTRDEVVLWDTERIWIYTQDRPFDGGQIYKPTRYPHYNASNYRAEISLP